MIKVYIFIEKLQTLTRNTSWAPHYTFVDKYYEPSRTFLL